MIPPFEMKKIMSLEEMQAIFDEIINQVNINSISNEVGTYKMSVKNTLEGYLFCNGAALSKTTYSALFEVIGTTFGSYLTTHFLLPDLRGRVMGMTGLESGVTRYLGEKVGTRTHQLTENEMPKHYHRSFWQAIGRRLQEVPDVATNDIYSGLLAGPLTRVGVGTSSTGGDAASADWKSGTGVGDPHSIMQPTLFAGNFFIKY